MDSWRTFPHVEHPLPFLILMPEYAGQDGERENHFFREGLYSLFTNSVQKLLLTLLRNDFQKHGMGKTGFLPIK